MAAPACEAWSSERVRHPYQIREPAAHRLQLLGNILLASHRSLFCRHPVQTWREPAQATGNQLRCLQPQAQLMADRPAPKIAQSQQPAAQ